MNIRGLLGLPAAFFDSVVPSTQAHGDSAATGVALAPARRDHKHAMPAEGAGPSQANQAAVEAETDEDTYVPPDLLIHNPGAVKAYCTVAGDGTLQANSYNITSSANDGDGIWTITIATDFANVNYAISLTPEVTGLTATKMHVDADLGGVAAGTFHVEMFDAAANRQNQSFHVIAIGDR